jgi:hypothetical protein
LHLKSPSSIRWAFKTKVAAKRGVAAGISDEKAHGSGHFGLHAVGAVKSAGTHQRLPGQNVRKNDRRVRKNMLARVLPNGFKRGAMIFQRAQKSG